MEHNIPNYSLSGPVLRKVRKLTVHKKINRESISSISQHIVGVNKPSMSARHGAITQLHCKARLTTSCTWSVKNVKLHGHEHDKNAKNFCGSCTCFCVALNRVMRQCVQSHEAMLTSFFSSQWLVQNHFHCTTKTNTKTIKTSMKPAGGTFLVPGMTFRLEKFGWRKRQAAGKGQSCPWRKSVGLGAKARCTPETWMPLPQETPSREPAWPGRAALRASRPGRGLRRGPQSATPPPCRGNGAACAGGRAAIQTHTGTNPTHKALGAAPDTTAPRLASAEGWAGLSRTPRRRQRPPAPGGCRHRESTGSSRQASRLPSWRRRWGGGSLSLPQALRGARRGGGEGRRSEE